MNDDDDDDDVVQASDNDTDDDRIGWPGAVAVVGVCVSIATIFCTLFWCMAHR